jgi:hypothetical protein
MRLVSFFLAALFLSLTHPCLASASVTTEEDVIVASPAELGLSEVSETPALTVETSAESFSRVERGPAVLPGILVADPENAERAEAPTELQP